MKSKEIKLLKFYKNHRGLISYLFANYIKESALGSRGTDQKNSHSALLTLKATIPNNKSKKYYYHFGIFTLNKSKL